LLLLNYGEDSEEEESLEGWGMDNEKDVRVQTAELEMSSKTCLSLS
jgi:hypothetical protein